MDGRPLIRLTATLYSGWTMFLLFVACTNGPPVETEPSRPQTSELPTTGDTALPFETSTGDTATTPTETRPWLYPAVPYDCSEGVPPGPPTARIVAGVWTTEDFVFDLDGFLVSADFDQNLVQWSPDGTPTVFSPGAGETRGIDLLGDGDIVFSNPEDGRLYRVGRSTGATSVLLDLSTPSASGFDVASDGTMVVADLNGFVFVVDPAGVPHAYQRLATQAYGASFSVDETRAYVSSYESSIYTLDLQPDGSWSDPVPWVDLPTNLLSGLVVDTCDNVYAISSLCELWRITPSGTSELLFDPPGGPTYMCPNLAFGRGLGGWDSHRLYVSTYGEVLELDVGVPGRPR